MVERVDLNPLRNYALVRLTKNPRAFSSQLQIETVNVIHFESAAAFRRWLEQNQATATALQVGFYKMASGRGGLTYQEAVDEALCFGWIDGIVRKIDADRYTHRFTPRKPGSHWSNLNVRHVARLTAAGRMHAAGLAALAGRAAGKTGLASYEQPAKNLPPADAKQFRANRPAWKFFTTQAPWYQRLAIHKIVSPKQAATRQRWLARIIAASAVHRRFP
ncbi:MAG: bacteriocin-protection protein [Opitutus sp.]|nr:bacteriocin-protection protein [Opitutus sp.]